MGKTYRKSETTYKPKSKALTKRQREKAEAYITKMTK
jgi:hypothetical protein